MKVTPRSKLKLIITILAYNLFHLDFNPPLKRKRKEHPNFRIFESKGTQTDPIHPVLSLLDGLKDSQHLFQSPLGFVQSTKLQTDDYVGVLHEFVLSIRCTNRPPYFNRFKLAVTNMYLIHITLGLMFGLAPDSLTLPKENPIVEHLSNPENRQNLFSSSEIENVLNRLAVFDWYNYRQIIVLFQQFLIEKVFNTLFQNFGNLYQVCQSSSHYVKILSYDTSSVLEDHLQAILKAQSYISGRCRQMNHNVFTISYRNEDTFKNASSELSLRYMFVITPAAQLSTHSSIIKRYRELHTPSTSGLG